MIAGGGFAGLYAAKYFDKHLARRADIDVTLMSRENFILFTPMLHEVAAGDVAPGWDCQFGSNFLSTDCAARNA